MLHSVIFVPFNTILCILLSIILVLVFLFILIPYCSHFQSSSFCMSATFFLLFAKTSIPWPNVIHYTLPLNDFPILHIFGMHISLFDLTPSNIFNGLISKGITFLFFSNRLSNDSHNSIASLVPIPHRNPYWSYPITIFNCPFHFPFTDLNNLLTTHVIPRFSFRGIVCN